MLVNWIAAVILATLLLDLIINAVADYLNLKEMGSELPEAFEGIYDADRYRKSQRYLQVNTRFGWVSAGVQTGLMLAFWFGRGFQWLDQWVRSLDYPVVVTGMIYVGVLLSITAIVSLPFSIYATFVIEERFGFNRTTWVTYVKDKLKGLGLALVLGAPLLAGILAFFEYAGSAAWWACWAVVTIYSISVQYIAPNWIMPLFNRFEPLEEGDLKSSIMTYAQSIDYPLKNVLVMDGSRRSVKSNAFFTGFGKNKRIVLFDTLIEQHTVDELVAVLAHEMGHYKKKHILLQLLLGIVQTGILFYLLSLFVSYRPLFEAFYLDQPSVYAGLIFFAMLYTPLDLLLGIFLQMLSRKNEYEADRFSVSTTRNPVAMISALKKLSVHNLANLVPHPFYVFLNYSHPPVLERIRAIEYQKVPSLQAV